MISTKGKSVLQGFLMYMKQYHCICLFVCFFWHDTMAWHARVDFHNAMSSGEREVRFRKSGLRVAAETEYFVIFHQLN